VAGVSPVPAQMWPERARSRADVAWGEPSPGTDVVVVVGAGTGMAATSLSMHLAPCHVRRNASDEEGGVSGAVRQRLQINPWEPALALKDRETEILPERKENNTHKHTSTRAHTSTRKLARTHAHRNAHAASPSFEETAHARAHSRVRTHTHACQNVKKTIILIAMNFPTGLIGASTVLVL
jgi:hypothetical protein